MTRNMLAGLWGKTMTKMFQKVEMDKNIHNFEATDWGAEPQEKWEEIHQ
jgi:hypothetical protein